MRVRVKFAKYGAMKFIGHLELMRFLHGAVRRAGLPVKYDEGMRRRMVMSFAMPLGVGPVSSAEYMDIEMDEPVPTKKALALLGAQMCEGLEILDFKEVDDSKKKKAMTIVAAAEYDVCFRQGYAPAWDWQEGLREMMCMEKIPWTKTTKKGTRELDMRPLIYSLSLCSFVPGEDGRLYRVDEPGCAVPGVYTGEQDLTEQKTNAGDPDLTAQETSTREQDLMVQKINAGDPDLTAQEARTEEHSLTVQEASSENKIRVDGFHACLCCSVGDNLKPEQLIGELYRLRGEEMPPFSLIVHRRDLLTRREEDGALISLGELGQEII